MKRQRSSAPYDVSLLDAVDGLTKHETMSGVTDDARVGQVNSDLIRHLLDAHIAVIRMHHRSLYRRVLRCQYLHFVEAGHPNVAFNPGQEAKGLVVARPVVDVETGQAWRNKDLMQQSRSTVSLDKIRTVTKYGAGYLEVVPFDFHDVAQEEVALALVVLLLGRLLGREEETVVGENHVAPRA
jgi:hypothetical protein